ncbi:MAG: ribosome biogenesis GTPase Der [Burkholderiales bacterium]
MKPVLVLVGRPNVGKSTLFNRLTRTRDALVAATPGLTRDRHYGYGQAGAKSFVVVDTGGLEPVAKQGILQQMARQTTAALAEADAILFLVDGREGVTAQDRRITEMLRRSGRPIWLVVNKTEGLKTDTVCAEFNELGIGEPIPIAAAHGEGVRDLVEMALAPFTPEDEAEDSRPGNPKIAIVGRPNVGKSTLINTLVGEERVIAFDEPGTTRDSIEVEFMLRDKPYTLVDTAGLRRRGKVFETIEKFSVVKTLQSIDAANVVILVLDAQQEFSEQDAHIAGFVLERGRALVVAVNKWDGMSDEARELAKRSFERKLGFLSYARTHNISAKHGRGLTALFASVNKAYEAANVKLSTPRLTRALIAAVEQQPPPRKGTVRPKMRYAHQGGMNPPIIVVHGNALSSVPESYRRFLEARFREAFELQGTPLRIEFRSGRNPYADSPKS